MPGSTPATSQLDWLSSTTAMIVLSWSKATRDLLKSFSWGIGALRQLFASDDGAISFAACPIPSLRWRKRIRTLGPRKRTNRLPTLALLAEQRTKQPLRTASSRKREFARASVGGSNTSPCRDYFTQARHNIWHGYSENLRHRYPQIWG